MTEKANTKQLANQKISNAKIKMGQPAARGGSPFLYVWMLNRRIVLTEDVHIAATDGKVYYFNPDMITKFDDWTLKMLIEHETLHILLDHPHRTPYFANRALASFAIDYIVNAYIYEQYRSVSKKLDVPDPFHQFPTVPLESLLRQLRGDENPTLHDLCLLADPDPALLEMSVAQVYNAMLEALQHWYRQHKPSSSPSRSGQRRDGGTESNDSCSGSASTTDQQTEGSASRMTDEQANRWRSALLFESYINTFLRLHEHMEPVARKELAEEILRVLYALKGNWAKSHPGTLGAGYERLLLQLDKPVLTLRQFLVPHMSHKLRQGERLDVRRPRRRLYGATGLYVPSRKGVAPKFLTLLDTSRSMSEEEIAFALSQLRTLTDYGAVGTVVCADADVYWEDATDIRNTRQLERVTLKGRGGTVFDQFFRDVWQHFPYPDYDEIIVLTDGALDTNHLINPRKEVIWVITCESTDFHPPFGKSILLR